jgi:superfamily II DNA or RNA helicase
MLVLCLEDILAQHGYNQKQWQCLVGCYIKHPIYGRGLVKQVTFGERIRFCVHYKDRNLQNFDQWLDLEPNLSIKVVVYTPLAAEILKDCHQVTQHPVTAPNEAPKLHIFHPNDQVYARNDPSQTGRISSEPILIERSWHYQVFLGAHDERLFRETDLVAYAPKIVWGGYNELLRDLAVAKIRKPLGDALYSLFTSRTKFEVYQFKPAVKFLANPDQRLLIADEVGLGKTIEAGIIYLELQARLAIERVLVVCPSSLRYKWQDELKSRFDEEFTVLDADVAKRFLDRYREFKGQVRLRGIISLELIRRNEFAEAFSEVKLDLVIIDEAHHCRNTTSLANAVATTLTENSDAALLLTATPLQLGREDLFNLLNILSPGEFDNYGTFAQRLEPNQYVNRAGQLLASKQPDLALMELVKVEGTVERERFLGNPYYKYVKDILRNPESCDADLIKAQRRLIELNTLASVFTRTRKRDVQTKVAKRTAFTLSVEFSSWEMDLYDQVLEQTRREYRMQSGSSGAWVTIMKERQLASCISAYMERQQASRKTLFPEDEVFGGDFAANSNGNSSTHQDDDNLHHLERFFNKTPSSQSRRPLYQSSSNRRDTKFEVFHSALAKVLGDNNTSKILVFSYFVGTIEYIKKQLLHRGIQALAIHGGYKVSDRQKTIEDFRDNPGIRILVSSDVGSEGLDFQFCDTVFNYDLPWNPMKVEQRIGRIDRFGQTAERVRIYNLVIENTIESRILMRLYERIEVFKQSIGDIEAILGDEIRALSQAVFSSHLTPQEQVEMTELAARNILRQKQELEEFDKQRLQFLGQEAIFNSTVNQTIESGRYISAPEVHALVQTYLEKQFPRPLLSPSDSEDTLLLHADYDLVTELKKFAEQRKSDITFQDFLSRFTPGQEIPITFSSDLATERKLLEFITPRHPLTQAAFAYWNKSNPLERYHYRLSLRHESIQSGSYYFFVFLLEARGINTEYRFVTVALKMDSLTIQPELSSQLIRMLQTSASNTPPTCIRIDENILITAEMIALGHAIKIKKEIEEEMTAMAEATANARITAIDQSYLAKRTRYENTRNKVDNASIKRMYTSMIMNLDARRKAKTDEINNNRSIVVSLSKQLDGIVEIDTSPLRLDT